MGGTFLVVVNDVAVKWISGAYPLHEIVLVRSVIVIPLILFVLAPLEGGRIRIRTAHPLLNISRGVLMAIANMGYFLGLAAMPLADAMAIFFIAPLFITALSVPLLGESVGYQRWLAVLVGMFGVIVMLRPGASAIHAAAGFPVVGALAYALMQSLARRLGPTDRASTMALYVHGTFFVIATVIGLTIGDGRFGGTGDASLDFLLRAWLWPAPRDLVTMMMCGLCMGIGGFLVTQAYRIGPASMVAPFEYTALPLGVILGIVLWNEIPGTSNLLGMALIVVGGLYVAYWEGRRKPGRLLGTPIDGC